MAELIVSPPILNELRTVLMRKFEQSNAEAEESVAFVAAVAQSVEIIGNLHVVLDDPADDKFVETASVGGAPYIVSGDRHLLALATYAGISIIGPRIFLDLLSCLHEPQETP